MDVGLQPFLVLIILEFNENLDEEIIWSNVK